MHCADAIAAVGVITFSGLNFAAHEFEQFAIADSALHESVSQVAVDLIVAVQAPGLGRGVPAGDRLGTLGQPVRPEVAADEAGATIDKYRHGQSPAPRLRVGNTFRSVQSASACIGTSKKARVPTSFKDVGAEAPFAQALRAALDYARRWRTKTTILTRPASIIMYDSDSGPAVA